jgi:membrane protein DedA with SNARE-associated domain
MESLIEYLLRYGYWLIFFAVLLEDFGAPLPGETLLIAGGILAGRGYFSIGAVIAVAFIAAVTGDNIGYALGYFGGRTLILRHGKRLFITRERLEKIEKFFRRYGGRIIIVARFVSGLRQLNGIVAGIAELPWKKFLFYNVVGAALWSSAWGLLAYVMGRKAEGYPGGRGSGAHSPCPARSTTRLRAPQRHIPLRSGGSARPSPHN